MRDRLVSIASFLVLAGLMSVGMSGIDAAEQQPSSMTVKAGEVQGKVADALGNAVVEEDIKVSSSDGELISQTATDADGKFEISLEKGVYKMAIGDMRVVTVEAKNACPVTNLALIVPMDAYSAGQAAGSAAGGGTFGWATSQGGFLGLSTAGLAAGGAGVVAVTGGAIAASNSGGSSGGGSDDNGGSVSPE